MYAFQILNLEINEQRRTGILEYGILKFLAKLLDYYMWKKSF